METKKKISIAVHTVLYSIVKSMRFSFHFFYLNNFNGHFTDFVLFNDKQNTSKYFFRTSWQIFCGLCYISRAFTTLNKANANNSWARGVPSWFSFDFSSCLKLAIHHRVYVFYFLIMCVFSTQFSSNIVYKQVSISIYICVDKYALCMQIELYLCISV